MHIIEYLKTPIGIAIIITLITIVLLYFYKKDEYKKDSKKFIMKYGIISAIVGIFAWIIITGYKEYNTITVIEEIPPNTEVIASSYRALEAKGTIKTPPPDIFIGLLDF